MHSAKELMFTRSVEQPDKHARLEENKLLSYNDNDEFAGMNEKTSCSQLSKCRLRISPKLM